MRRLRLAQRGDGAWGWVWRVSPYPHALSLVSGLVSAKVALDVGAGTAGALVAVDLVRSVFIDIVASSML